MPQPTTNSCPFAVKVIPSAEGHIGAEVAGAGTPDDATVAGKPADTEFGKGAGDLGGTAAELESGTREPEGPGTEL